MTPGREYCARQKGGHAAVTLGAMSAGRGVANAVGDVKGRGGDTPLDAWLLLMRVTRQEQRVVHLVERGLTNPEIAALLGVSPNTVRNQMASVFTKLRVSRRAELVYILGRVRGGDV